MRAIFRIASSLLFVALVGACQSRSNAEEPIDKSLAQLAKQLARLPTDGDPSTLKLPSYASVARVPQARIAIAFAPPVDARELARAFKWARPYAYGWDRHKRHWRLQVFVKDVPDPDPASRRIATAEPELGPWTVSVDLVARPPGVLPAVYCGASVAYDLEQYAAQVERLILTKRQ